MGSKYSSSLKDKDESKVWDIASRRYVGLNDKTITQDDDDPFQNITSAHELQESYIGDVLLARFNETLEGLGKCLRVESQDTQESYKPKSSKLEMGIKETSSSIYSGSIAHEDTIQSITSTELQESYAGDIQFAKLSKTLEGPEKCHTVESKDTQKKYKPKSSKLEKSIKETSGSIEAHSLTDKKESLFSKHPITSFEKGSSHQKEMYYSGDNLLEKSSKTLEGPGTHDDTISLEKRSKTLEGSEKCHKVESQDTQETYKPKLSKRKKGIKETSGSKEAHSLTDKKESLISKQ